MCQVQILNTLFHEMKCSMELYQVAVKRRRRRRIAKCERDSKDAIYFVVYLSASFVAQ